MPARRGNAILLWATALGLGCMLLLSVPCHATVGGELYTERYIAAKYFEGDSYRLGGDLDKAKHCFEQGIAQSRADNKPLAEAIGKYYMAALEQIYSSPDRADSLVLLALVQMHQYGYYGHYYCAALNILCYDAAISGKYTRAVQIAQQVVKMAGKNGDLVNEGQALNNMGLAYYGIDVFGKADSLQKEGISRLRRTTQYAVLGELLSDNMATLYARADYEQSLRNGREALYLFTHRQMNKQSMAYTAAFLADAHGGLGHEDSMLHYLRQAEILNAAIRDPVNSANLYATYAEFFIKKQQWDSVTNILERFLGLGIPYAPEMLISFHSGLADAYESKGDTKSALANLRAMQALKDSVDDISVRSTIEEMDRKYQAAVKDEQIRNLNYRSQVSARQNLLLIIIITLLVVVTGLILWQYFRKQRALNIIASQRERLGFLMKEIHHRVKNNLQVVSSLMSLQLETLNDPVAEAAFENTQLRIGSMALLHQKLYQDDADGMVDLDDYLAQLVAVATDTHGYGQELRTQIGKSGIRLSIDISSPIGLIITELIINSCKYAALPDKHLQISVDVAQVGKNIEMHYRDNGPGMPEGWEQRRHKSLGMKLVQIMIRQLKGKMYYAHEEGCFFRFVFSG